MPNFICATCGTQHNKSDQPPGKCFICEDDRQYVKATGQQWTTHDKLRLTNRNSIRFEEPNLIGIGVEPQFAIGQRAILVRSPKGNVLWDCVSLVDPALIELVKALGGISAIAISHPHYYTSMVEWSRAFGDVPIYLHAADKRWVMRPDKSIEYWDGDKKLLGDGLTLIRCGGHFDGGTVLHWRDSADAKGVPLTGDIIQVVADRTHVSFMYSYPNYVPLSAGAVERIVRAVEPFEYERVYGAFWDAVIERDGKKAVARSAERYLRAITGETKRTHERYRREYPSRRNDCSKEWRNRHDRFAVGLRSDQP